jgi:hypothetical protein
MIFIYLLVGIILLRIGEYIYLSRQHSNKESNCKYETTRKGCGFTSTDKNIWS